MSPPRKHPKPKKQPKAKPLKQPKVKPGRLCPNCMQARLLKSEERNTEYCPLCIFEVKIKGAKNVSPTPTRNLQDRRKV